MPYRFQLDEPVADGFRRIGDEQIKLALKALGGEDPAAVVTGIHDARKALKRIRALLRLGRIGLGDKSFHHENKRFRDIAQALSGARDAHVMMKTLEALTGAAGEDGRSDATATSVVPQLAKLLASRADAAHGAAQDGQIGTALKQLKSARRTFARLDIGEGFDVIEAGLAKVYRDCRAAFADAYALQTDAAFHEWRKTVQQHWRQMRLVGAAWPDMMQARADLARAISNLLGDDHDLAVLLAFVGAHTDGEIPKREAKQVEKLARARQAAIRAAAKPMGERLLAQSGRALPRQIKRCWIAAVDAGEAGTSEPPASA